MMDYRLGDDDGRRPAMILISDGPQAEALGRATARDAGVDLVRSMRFAAFLEGDQRALAADLLFVEAMVDDDAATGPVFARAARLARGGQAIIGSITPALIDIAAARLGDAPVSLLCAATTAERIAEIGLATAGHGAGVRQDGEGRADALRTIGIDLSRIAERLVGLAERTATPIDSAPPPVIAAAVPGAAVSAADYRRILRERRLRDAYLGDALFADPAWDMLLDLAAARLEGNPVAVSSLCIAAAVPPTTALRWIRVLTERGLLCRTPDAHDGRRVFMTLSDTAAAAMDGYLHAIMAARAA